MSINHATTRSPYSWTVSTELSTGSRDERPTVDAAPSIRCAPKGFAAHRHQFYDLQRDLFEATQLEHRRRSNRHSQRAFRERQKEKDEQSRVQCKKLEEQNRELEEQKRELEEQKRELEEQYRELEGRHRELQTSLINNTGFGTFMPMTRANPIGNIDKRGDDLVVYTHDLNNSFTEGQPMVGQPLKFRHNVFHSQIPATEKGRDTARFRQREIQLKDILAEEI
ncbi:hypothetical protein V495_00179 [Pseudogymnoascus sp. VKM F-4514 (FW-929)]|nr:hypothetical protein V495_00179 [Pseudogymnoascus sp. VKM F-4514 (FW-929)]KFY66824.1 hypothetical protein V497_00667 [Pseudogymnoascus sp. VKM F-4516 (FW-969)]